MEVDSVGIIAILSMSYITTRIVKTKTSVVKIPRVPVENEITTLSVVKITIKFSPYRLPTWSQKSAEQYLDPTLTYLRNVFAFYVSTGREFLRKMLYKNIAIIAIQHDKFILLTPLAIFPILLGEIHSSPSGKFPYTY